MLREELTLLVCPLDTAPALLLLQMHSGRGSFTSRYLRADWQRGTSTKLESSERKQSYTPNSFWAVVKCLLWRNSPTVCLRQHYITAIQYIAQSQRGLSSKRLSFGVKTPDLNLHTALSGMLLHAEQERPSHFWVTAVWLCICLDMAKYRWRDITGRYFQQPGVTVIEYLFWAIWNISVRILRQPLQIKEQDLLWRAAYSWHSNAAVSRKLTIESFSYKLKEAEWTEATRHVAFWRKVFKYPQTLDQTWFT